MLLCHYVYQSYCVNHCLTVYFAVIMCLLLCYYVRVYHCVIESTCLSQRYCVHRCLTMSVFITVLSSQYVYHSGTVFIAVLLCCCAYCFVNMLLHLSLSSHVYHCVTVFITVSIAALLCRCVHHCVYCSVTVFITVYRDYSCITVFTVLLKRCATVLLCLSLCHWVHHCYYVAVLIIHKCTSTCTT